MNGIPVGLRFLPDLLAINPKERWPFLQRHFAGGSEPVSKVYDGVEWTDKDVRI
jgi:hypothetical protein